MVCLAVLFLLAQAANVPSDAKPLVEFKARVASYMTVQKQVVGKVGALDPTKSPKQIADREAALGQATRAARPNAKQGDLLSPQVGAIFRTIIYNEFKHRSQLALKNREDSQDELPDFTPTVNQIYPAPIRSRHFHRACPQKGIYYFVQGGAAKLRENDIEKSAETAKGFDTDRSFTLMEIAGDELFFQTISRRGQTVDSGVVPRRQIAK